jgi:class 3 adenylate cyclase
MRPTTRYAHSGGVHLAYQVIGSGPRDVVFVLDWGSHLEELWEQPFVEEIIRHMARYARVLWFDMRGVGLSDRIAEDTVAAEDWMNDVAAVLDAAGSCSASIVAQGHAAQMALLFAATNPERTESLVLINGFARLSRADDHPIGMPPAVQQIVLDTIEQTWGTGTDIAVLAPSIADEPGIVDWWAKVQRYAASPGTALAKMRAALELDVRDVLPLVKAPTLVVQNRDNWLVRADHGRHLAAAIPNAQLLERDAADHWPLADPDLLAAIEEFLTGAAVPAGEADRMLGTVLMVDVVASTERASIIGDRHWDLLLSRFQAAAREAIKLYSGTFIASAGDGVVAVFDGPARAIRCAESIRDRVHELGLSVRTGLHSGELTRHGEEISGIAVHIAARVAAAAEPDHIVVTRTVRDLVAGSGIPFDPRGEHMLKGLEDPWQLYAVA